MKIMGKSIKCFSLIDRIKDFYEYETKYNGKFTPEAVERGWNISWNEINTYCMLEPAGLEWVYEVYPKNTNLDDEALKGCINVTESDDDIYEFENEDDGYKIDADEDILLKCPYLYYKIVGLTEEGFSLFKGELN